MLNQILQLKFNIAQLEAMIKHSEENLPRVSQERDYYKQGFERLSKENEQLKKELLNGRNTSTNAADGNC